MEQKFINFGVETTNTCNANCSFCGYRFMERPKVEMPKTIFEKSIQNFAQNGGGNLNFTPTVGDPLVDQALLERIQFARQYSEVQDIFLYTNGILLDRFGFANLLTSGLSRLAISTFIGSREGYKKYYGNDKYLKVVANIIAVAKENLRLEKPIKITLHLRVHGDRSSWEKTDVYREIVSLIGAKNVNYLDVYDAWGGRIHTEDIPDGTSLDQPISLKEKIKSPCFEMYRRLHVLADGKVGACVCVDLESEIKVGDISTQTLSQIWAGPRIREYRAEWVKGNLPEVCKQCTRYQAIDKFIKTNPKRIVIDYVRRRWPKTLKFLTH
jgi:radical SAM protein with 4Fe4S-binding SPASM domain